MRKSLWIVPLLFLSTVIGSTTARADTVVTSGGNAVGINGLTFDGTIYNVTFVTTIDTTFASSFTDAQSVVNEIATDLSSYKVVSDSVSNTISEVGVDGGTFSWVDLTDTGSVTFTSTAAFSPSAFPNEDAWASFQIVSSVPELNLRSGTSAMILLACAVLIIRGRRPLPTTAT